MNSEGHIRMVVPGAVIARDEIALSQAEANRLRKATQAERVEYYNREAPKRTGGGNDYKRLKRGDPI